MFLSFFKSFIPSLFSFLRKVMTLLLSIIKNSMLDPFLSLLSHSSVSKESACNAGDPSLIPGLGRSSGEGIGYPTSVFLGFPCGSAGKESSCNAGDLGSIHGLERSPGEGKGYPLQYSGLENSIGYSPWGLKESDMTQRLLLTHSAIAKFLSFLKFIIQ